MSPTRAPDCTGLDPRRASAPGRRGDDWLQCPSIRAGTLDRSRRQPVSPDITDSRGAVSHATALPSSERRLQHRARAAIPGRRGRVSRRPRARRAPPRPPSTSDCPERPSTFAPSRGRPAGGTARGTGPGTIGARGSRAARRHGRRASTAPPHRLAAPRPRAAGAEMSSSSEFAAHGWSIGNLRKARRGTTRPRTSSSAVTEADRARRRSPTGRRAARRARARPAPARAIGAVGGDARAPARTSSTQSAMPPCSRIAAPDRSCRARPCLERVARAGVSVWRRSVSLTCRRPACPAVPASPPRSGPARARGARRAAAAAPTGARTSRRGPLRPRAAATSATPADRTARVEPGGSAVPVGEPRQGDAARRLPAPGGHHGARCAPDERALLRPMVRRRQPRADAVHAHGRPPGAVRAGAAGKDARFLRRIRVGGGDPADDQARLFLASTASFRRAAARTRWVSCAASCRGSARASPRRSRAAGGSRSRAAGAAASRARSTAGPRCSPIHRLRLSSPS